MSATLEMVGLLCEDTIGSEGFDSGGYDSGSDDRVPPVSRKSGKFRRSPVESVPSSVKSFYKRAGRSKLLTLQEELELGRRISLGDEEAKRILVESNLRLVVSIALRYCPSGLPLEDALQEGCIGLIQAAEKYDYRKGFRFSTYATWWIWQAVTRAIGEKGRTIRVPLDALAVIRKIRHAAEALAQVLGRPPSVSELADSVGLPEAKVASLLRATDDPISLETPVNDEDVLVADMVAAPDPSPSESVLSGIIQREEIEALLRNLTDREREVIELRFGLNGEPPLTLKEVARRFRVSRERVRQIETQALDKLRRTARTAGAAHVGRLDDPPRN
ncbi:MAG: sigma-70 family RNA polymerase sigma factor [Armatimonadota bacterium]